MATFNTFPILNYLLYLKSSKSEYSIKPNNSSYADNPSIPFLHEILHDNAK